MNSLFNLHLMSLIKIVLNIFGVKHFLKRNIIGEKNMCWLKITPPMSIAHYKLQTSFCVARE